MLDLLTSPDAWITFIFLAAMEIVLGIDNIIFITIAAGRLPRSQQLRARRLGLAFALMTRVLLLLSINWIANLTEPLFTLGRPWAGRDLILVSGGLYLIYKSIAEFFEDVEDEDPGADGDHSSETSLPWVVAQIMVLDIVFSLDSVITAVGMANDVRIMVAAVMTAVAVMLFFIGPVGDFIQQNPSIKVLALSSLLLVGGVLILEGWGAHVEKGGVYTALGFALFVQLADLRRQRRMAAYEREKLGHQSADG
jgi:predicted tellurium resistance membrane protein TerC